MLIILFNFRSVIRCEKGVAVICQIVVRRKWEIGDLFFKNLSKL